MPRSVGPERVETGGFDASVGTPLHEANRGSIILTATVAAILLLNS
jgi:hypothetical protein